MTLNEYVSVKRKQILERLSEGHPPAEGSYDEKRFRDLRDSGKPQMGPTSYEPLRIHVDFVYPGQKSSASILTVTLDSPERIVYMPVPEWVLEQIWQGDVQGSYQFENDAARMLDGFAAQLKAPNNAANFGPPKDLRRN